MGQKTAAVIGVTGLIGSQLLEILKQDKEYETIRLIVRRLYTDTDPKTEMKLVNFDDYESLKLAIDGCDVVYCAVGTTQKKVKGDKAAYRKIDYDIPATAARACSETHCPSFILISSAGADAESNNFYLKLKGEVEQAILKFPIPSVSVLRPSMLLGERKEYRLGERIGQPLIKLIAPLLKGNWTKYKPIEAKAVARAMVQAAKNENRGFLIYEYDQIQALT